MNMNTIMLPLSEIATWERAKAGKEYPAGTILLRISATRGRLVFVEDGGKVKPSMYAAIVPDTAKVDPYYLYTILEMQMPEFLHQYQTGLSIQPDILKFLVLQIHTDLEVQQNIASQQRKLAERIKEEEHTVTKLQDLKAWFLNGLFV